jgi:CRISPR-associated protein Csm2
MSDLEKKIQFGDQLSAELYSDTAKQTAAIVFQAGLDQRGNKKNNKSTQLRKFYDELTMWNDKVQQLRGKELRDKKYAELAPFIKMLTAKVAYAKGRDHVDPTFENLFAHCIKSIKDAETLKHCKLFIEAFMGFYKAQEK